MDIPKPHDFRVTPPKADSIENAQKEKREFIRTAHLNQKPFKTSELAQLRKALQEGKR